MIVLESFYGEQYHQDAVKEPALQSTEAIVSVINRIYSPQSVLDVGCSGGGMLRAWKKLGVPCAGVDGDPAAARVSPDCVIITHDLRKAVEEPIIPMCHMLTCFDVAEHIEPEFSEQFVRTLVEHTLPDGYVILGPAGEGQEGHGHVNCQHPCYWIARMEAVGLRLLPFESEFLRSEIKKDPQHSFYWWVAKNLMVFQKATRSWQTLGR